MAINPYQQCPCGSGKQFKWCCQAYYSYVEKAEQLLREKQIVAAGDIFAKLTKDHPKIPQVWVYQAEYFYANEQNEAAEAAIQQALNLDANFAMAYWFKGMMRENEGESTGALILYRKAAEHIHPEATERLALIQSRIAELELGQGHPVAGRFALDQALKAMPQSQELRESHDRIFGNESHLPDVARLPHQLRPNTDDAAWTTALDAATKGKLQQAAVAFEQITTSNPTGEAWYNLGLVRAWQGDNRKAIDALLRAVDLAGDDFAAQAALLAEVLRLGRGLESDADYVTHRAVLEIRDPDAVGTFLNSLGEQNRLVAPNADRESGVFNCLILEQTNKFGVSVGVPIARICVQMLIYQNSMLLWHSNREMLDGFINELKDAINLAVGQPNYEISVAELANPMTEMLAFPTGPGVTPEAWDAARDEQLRAYFEDKWLNKPLKSLAGVTPIDGAAHPSYRKRLAGIIQFMEQAVHHFGRPQEDGTRKPLYDFDRVRRKLGLVSGAPIEGGRIDFDLLSAADLGKLDPNTLNDQQVGDGYRAALRLDAPDLAAKFASNATTRATIADRYPFFTHLVKMAKEAGNTDTMLQLLEQGEAADHATNNGQRRGAYGIARGRAYAQAGNIAQAAEAFRQAISANVDDVQNYAPAAETMLGKKAGAEALAFAEQGLAKAREHNNRDAEQQFMELVAAARKMLG